jgi:hypothetical protein
MRKSVLLVLFLLALGVVAVACDSSDPTLAVQSTEDVKRISPADAKALLDDGAAVLYDTRSLDQYSVQHAAGAVSFPLGEESARFNELPEDKALIFYCT